MQKQHEKKSYGEWMNELYPNHKMSERKFKILHALYTTEKTAGRLYKGAKKVHKKLKPIIKILERAGKTSYEHPFHGFERE